MTSIDQNYLVVVLSSTLTSMMLDVDAMLLCILFPCQVRTGTVTQLVVVMDFGIAMPHQMTLHNAQRWISWKPTDSPGTLPHIIAMPHRTKDTTTGVTQLAAAIKSHGNKTKVLTEKTRESIPLTLSTSKLTSTMMVSPLP